MTDAINLDGGGSSTLWTKKKQEYSTTRTTTKNSTTRVNAQCRISLWYISTCPKLLFCAQDGETKGGDFLVPPYALFLSLSQFHIPDRKPSSVCRILVFHREAYANLVLFRRIDDSDGKNVFSRSGIEREERMIGLLL